MSTTTLNIESLISSYETYAPPPAELTLRDFDTTPTLSPTPLIASFFTAASIECVQFRIGVSSAPVTTTLATVCWKWSALKRTQNEHQEL